MSKRRPLKMSTIGLYGCQIKSLEIAREVAAALDVIEKQAGIHSVTIEMDECFVCPDINLDALDKTPMERVLSSVMRDQLQVNLKTGRQG